MAEIRDYFKFKVYAGLKIKIIAWQLAANLEKVLDIR